MTTGIMRCYGSIPKIKSIYGHGFNLFVKLNRPTAEELKKLTINSGWDGLLSIPAPTDETADKIDYNRSRVKNFYLSYEEGHKCIQMLRLSNSGRAESKGEDELKL